MKPLRLNQAIRNLTCGDLDIAHVVIGLGVTALKKGRVHGPPGFVWGMGGGGGRMGGAILCVWSAFDWANFGSVGVFFTNGEYGFSFMRSWYWIWNLRTKLCCLA